MSEAARCEGCGRVDKPLDQKGYCPTCVANRAEWEQTQLSLAQHIEAWRAERGLTVVETSDLLESILMFQDEQLEAAMHGDDLFGDETVADLEGIAERTRELLEEDALSMEEATALLAEHLASLGGELERLREELERLANEPDALFVGRVGVTVPVDQTALKKKRGGGE